MMDIEYHIVLPRSFLMFSESCCYCVDHDLVDSALTALPLFSTLLAAFGSFPMCSIGDVVAVQRILTRAIGDG